MKSKIVSINELKLIIKSLKKKNKKIILCHGVFDLLHLGHINHFQKAKKNGDILVVSVTQDKYVNKGPGRPTFNEKNRLDALASLSVIDYVVLNNARTSVSIIKEVKPHIYCKGPDYKDHKNDITSEIKNEINAIKKVKGKIIYTSGKTFSSSNLINNSTFLSNSNNSVKNIRKKYSFSEIKSKVNLIGKLKILVIGETIIDNYVFCEALGKSGKEPVLALRKRKSETYLGGAAAIAGHLSTFNNNLKLLTMIGDKNDRLKTIKEMLPKNVKLEYFKKKNSPTIYKRRFVDDVSKNKLLGVYDLNDEILNKNNEKMFIKKLKKNLPNFDLVIVTDYGHGFISSQAAKLICKNSNFFSLNAQINAANIGYHTMQKYKNIDCLIINENEIRQELRNKDGDLKGLMKFLSKKQNIKDLIVTRGDQGSILFNKRKNNFQYSDAFSKKALDKIGAGDTMLSLVSTCLKIGMKKDLALFIGSLAAAFSVETIGNKFYVHKNKILKSIDHLLK
tara:strand:+ start:701 stop:2218 length:1518 start_codon:yes stop_codon:yes gene_type:complete